MPQTKYNCPSCRRLIDINSQACPYCSTLNPKFKKMTSNTEKKEVELETADDIGEALFDDLDLENLSSVNNMKSSSTNAASKTHVANATSNSEEEYLVPTKQPKAIPDSTTHKKNEQTESLSIQNNRREKISWTDEEKKNAESSRESMYSSNGSYNANFDGYYDDILPKINDEVDKILLNKEKTILKIIGAAVIVVGIIIYLVVTLN